MFINAGCDIQQRRELSRAKDSTFQSNVVAVYIVTVVIYAVVYLEGIYRGPWPAVVQSCDFDPLPPNSRAAHYPKNTKLHIA